MWSFRWKQRVLELEGDLRALRKDFQTLEQYVDDRLRLVRNAENRIAKKTAVVEAQDASDESPNGNTLPENVLGRALTPRETAIMQIARRRRMTL